MIKLNPAGEAHCLRMVAAGKVNDGPWSFDAADRAKLLGPNRNHIEEYARHHLGVEDDDQVEDDGDERDLDSGSGAGAEPTKLEHERFKHPFGKDGEVYIRALKNIRSSAVKFGQSDVWACADRVLKAIDELSEESDRSAEETQAGPERCVGLRDFNGATNRSPEASVSVPPREVRCLMAGLKLRAAAKGPGTIEGYAAVFDRFSEDLGHFREKIAPGAFASCLNQDIRALKNHDPGCLLGRAGNDTLRLAEDGLGLRVEIDLPDTQVGRDTATEIRRGDLDGMSFSFDTAVDQWDHATTPPTRTLLSCSRLYDVGPVAFPAYADTSAAMRSLDRSRPAPTSSALPTSLSLSLALARQRLAEANSPL